MAIICMRAFPTLSLCSGKQEQEFSQLVCPGQTVIRVTLELTSKSGLHELSQLSCPGQTRARVGRELMRVGKREFARQFSQLSCPGQTFPLTLHSFICSPLEIDFTGLPR